MPQMKPGPQKAQQIFGPLPKIINQHRGEIARSDSTAAQLLTIALLRQIRLIAESPERLEHRLFEWEVLKSVARIVMHEDSDRSLRRQQMGGVRKSPPQSVQPRR